MQDLDSVTWGIFQIYIYDNLFNSNQNNKIQDKKRLNKKTIGILLNKLIILGDQQTNEQIIRQYANKRNIIVH